MSDIDLRYPAFRENNSKERTTLRLKCDDCGRYTDITKEDKARIIKELDPRFPAQSITVPCSCGMSQFILKAKSLKN